MEVSWVLSARNLLKDCPVLYTECGYKGIALKVCLNIPSTPKVLYKSIFVPKGMTVYLYTSENY